MEGCLYYRPCYARCHYLVGVPNSFRGHHIPAWLMRLKKEFLSLKKGGMSVTEYWDRFIKLSRYALEEVADDPKKQEHFMAGLAGLLRYQLMSNTFPSFQHLLDKAITLESMRREPAS
jgi:hypothetical protein